VYRFFVGQTKAYNVFHKNGLEKKSQITRVLTPRALIKEHANCD
jgi:hypothetical protein